MVFNSLGSNYNFRYALKALFSRATKDDAKKLVSYLELKYSGKALLLYKGREALKLSLQLLDLQPKSKVGITGYTCYVVYQAVKEVGYQPEYLDIQNGDLNFGLKEVVKHKEIKALILQNTLGSVCDIKNIKRYCQDNKIYLIEDLAHCAGIKYDTGEEVGTIGDFVALSFSQDKSIDAVTGGALVIRNEDFIDKFKNIKLRKPRKFHNFKNRIYPILTYTVRKTYPYGLGKILHLFLKGVNLLSKPVEDVNQIKFHKLPYWNCKIALSQLLSLNNDIKHRQKIVSVYKNVSSKNNLGILRWPLLVKNRKKFIDYMKKSNIFISDTWYTAPVAPQKFMDKTNYKIGDCPNSERVTEHIINLPTHINVSTKEAKFISRKVKRWQSTN